jgi:hypothetical protein
MGIFSFIARKVDSVACSFGSISCIRRENKCLVVGRVHQVLPPFSPIIVKIYVLSWLNASYMLNTCKSKIVFGELVYVKEKKG